MKITVSYYLHYNYNGNPYNPRCDWVQDEEIEAASAEELADEALRLIEWIKSGEAEEEDEINDFRMRCPAEMHCDGETIYDMDWDDTREDIIAKINEAAYDIADDIIRELRDELIDEQEALMTEQETADTEALEERGIIKLDDNGDYIGVTGRPFDFYDFAEDFIDFALSDDCGRLHDLFEIEDYSGARDIAEDIIRTGYDDYFDAVAGRYYTFDEYEDK